MAEDDNDKTPPPPPADTPEHDDAKDTGSENHAECKSMIQGLSERVSDLETQLRAVLMVKPDSTPVKGPWTHRKF
jgi:hypothetical protein